uniref:hypothetical protein n=1 Tax=Halobacterium sp. (strain GN101) TaxID=88773 RepID=UPI00159EC1B4|nr:hypothetical protein [Halobacterium sp. GN101]
MGNSFKQGAGDLDFGGDSAADEDEADDATGPGPDAADPAPTEQGATSETDGHTYPYFVRRNTVGDERDNRLEVFARDRVVAQEAEFRRQLAARLDTDAVSKTDAREYALLAAFDNVDAVADRMANDGYGETE